ncbi:hypothetical protein Taro_030406 [Colocasia esculenta]|uniref:Uncharacterized protein n=1 Tax=Colocasia esculenta TaxID=4460 RepID=A0A843VTY8_COLES|nr:hypothetical protein [Colocasia esculenta]
MNSCDSKSLPEESRGVSLSNKAHPLPARAAGTPISGSKTTLQSSKVRNAYHRVLKSSGNREMPRPQPGSGQTRLPQNQQTTQCGSNPRHTPAETKKLTEPRSNHVRPESHDTNTNIPDLREVGKEHPGVTPRDTKQPSENDVSPQAQPPQTSTRLRAHKQNHPAPRALHEIRELHTPMPPQTAPRNGLPKQQLGAYTRHPERTHRTETTNPAHEAKLTKPTELDMARLQPPCKLGQRETILGNSVRNTVTQEHTSHHHRQLREGHTVNPSRSPAVDSCLRPP